jgi:zinc protease
VMPELLYGAGHAYGNPGTGSGTVESVSKMTRQDLVHFHDVWFRPNNTTLIIVGDTTIAELKPKLEKLFANWKSGKVPEKNIKTVALAATPTVYIMDKPGAQQSVIVVGSVAPPEANPQEIAIESLVTGLGGSFSSRINLNLREDKHYSYGVRTQLTGAKGQRPFLTIAPVQTDKTKESLIELDREFRGIAGDKPMTDEELTRVKANETLKLPGSRETIAELGGSISNIVHYGLPDNYYETYSGKVEALKTADIAAATKTLVHPENLTWVIVGDRAKIEAGVKELNLGELKFLAPDGKPLQ